MMKRTELVFLILILAVAAGFRLYGLGSAPPGLYPDEAMNGNDAIQALDSGSFKVFYPENNGREGLFINLQAISINFLGNTPYALRVVSAIIGLFTVLGTYLLARRMFDSWELAAIVAFLMAVGFWHVNFSRIGFRAIMAPFCAVWAMYYLYRGIETTRLWPWLVSGFFLGLGFHTYIAFRVMPAVAAVAIIAFLYSLHKHFQHDKFAHARNQLIGSMAVMAAVMLIVLIPMASYFYANPQELSGRTNKISVFATDHGWQQMAVNYGKNLSMFVLHGDNNWRHGIAGQPALVWPIAAFFAIGLLRSFYKAIRTWRTHGHPSVVHVLLLAWLFIGLAPASISNEGIPHALRALVVAPVVYIIAGQGVWWLYTWLMHWYRQRDVHRICLPGPNGHQYCAGEGKIIVTATLVVFLFAIGVAEAVRYSEWNRNPAVRSEFTEQYIGIAERLDKMPPATLKYVVATRGDILVNDIPMSAQTVMFLTDTSTDEKQKQKNIYYLTKDQFDRRAYPKNAFVIQLDP